jgi:undecaprenyl-diphosphatase
MLNGIIIGIAQGVLEWLPVSSEGAVWLLMNQLEGISFEASVKYALLLHLATFPSAVVVFRKQIVDLIVNLFQTPSKPDTVTVFLAISFVVSGFVGLFMMKIIEFISPSVGPLGMLMVGVFLILTGCLAFFKLRHLKKIVLKPVEQIYQLGLIPNNPSIDFNESTIKLDGFNYRHPLWKRVLVDSLILGLVQGCAVLPGLSRSGVTISLLLYRGVEKNNAVAMSFLMSIPASIAASSYVIATNTNISFSTPILVSGLTAFIIGAIFIKVILKFIAKINLTFFIWITGIFIISGGLFEILVR